MLTTHRRPLKLGAISRTPGSFDLNYEDILRAINRHRIGDWGELDLGDKAANNEAVERGERVLSAYTDRQGIRFYIITEADRDRSTVLLPEEY